MRSTIFKIYKIFVCQVELMDIFIEILRGIFNKLTRISERKRRMKEIKKSLNPLGGLKLSQPFILLRSIKWVPGTPWDLVVKLKSSDCSYFVVLRQLKLIHKKEP